MSDQVERFILFLLELFVKPNEEIYSCFIRIVCQTKWRGQVADGPVIVRLEKATSQYHTNFHYRVSLIESDSHHRYILIQHMLSQKDKQ